MAEAIEGTPEDAAAFRFPPGWYAVADAAELGDTPLKLRRFGRDWVLWRDGDAIHALGDRCPHRGASLSLGWVKDGQIVCPFHGLRFDGAGRCTRVPAHPERGIPRALCNPAASATEAHGYVWLWHGPGEPDAAAPPWFEDLTRDYRHHGFAADWDAHFTRCVENQLDYAHLPYVHRSTIGRGMAPAMDDMVVEADAERIRVHRAGRARQYVELRFPNVWVNRIGRSFVHVAFAPIDARTTRLYVRGYQNRIRFGPLARALGWVGNLANRLIIGQDQRVVESQRPRISPLGKGDVLLPSDAAIIAFRRWLVEAQMPTLSLLHPRPADAPRQAPG